MAVGNLFTMPVSSSSVYPCPNSFAYCLKAEPVVSGTTVKMHYRLISESGRTMKEDSVTIPTSWTTLKSLIPAGTLPAPAEPWEGAALMVLGIEGGYVYSHAGTGTGETLISAMSSVPGSSMVFAGEVLGQASPIRPLETQQAYPGHQLPLINLTLPLITSTYTSADQGVTVIPSHRATRLLVKLIYTGTSITGTPKLTPGLLFRLHDYGCVNSANMMNVDAALATGPITLSSLVPTTSAQTAYLLVDAPAAGRYKIQMTLDVSGCQIASGGTLQLWQFIH